MHDISAWPTVSVRRNSISGHSPNALRDMHVTDMHISAVLSGTPIRLLIRKYGGKVPKCQSTAGAVKIWHDMLSAAADHILFMIGFPSSGYMAFSRG